MIQSIVLPGRFPTTFYAYPEFTLLDRNLRDEVQFENLNLLFWEYIFSPRFPAFLRRHLGRESLPEIRFLTAVNESGVIRQMQRRRSFYDPAQYLATLSSLGGYLAVASQLLRRLSDGNARELSVYGLRYEPRHSLSRILAYARSDRSPVMDFYRTQAGTIRGIFSASIVSAVTYDYTDVLHLGLLSECFRRKGTTVLIHGHSWENNALDYLIERRRQYAEVLRHVDGVVLAEDRLAETFNHLLENGTSAKTGNLHRFGDEAVPCDDPSLQKQDVPDNLDFARLRREAERQRPRIFSPELVTLFRLSSRGCYWRQCAFCHHNSRHGLPPAYRDTDSSAPARWADSLRLLSKISPTIVFCDQGMDPEAAAAFAAVAHDSGIKARWSLRTRIDPRWDARRIARMARGGCGELIFGLESVNDDTLRRMNKTPLTGKAYRALARQIHHDSAARGIFNHYCVIYGYPGETYEACRRTLGFLGELVRTTPKTTFSLNRFQLLYGTDIFKSPRVYGIQSVTTARGLSNMFRYREPRSQRCIERVEKEITGFYEAAGYRKDILAEGVLRQMVPFFVNDSGHAPLLKAGRIGNPFMAPSRP